MVRSKLILSLGNANSRHQTFIYIHVLGQVLHTDHNPIIDIGGDKYKINNTDSLSWKIKWGDRR